MILIFRAKTFFFKNYEIIPFYFFDYDPSPSQKGWIIKLFVEIYKINRSLISMGFSRIKILIAT